MMIFVPAKTWMDGHLLGRGFLHGEQCVSDGDAFPFFDVPTRSISSGSLKAFQGLPVDGKYGPNRISTGTKYVLKLRFGH